MRRWKGRKREHTVKKLASMLCSRGISSRCKSMVMYRVWTEFWRFICPIVGLLGTPVPTPSRAPAVFAAAPGTAVDALDVRLFFAEVEVDFSLSAAEG